MSFSDASRFLLAGLACLACAAPSESATVAQVGTLDLVERSQLIFHGTVRSHRVIRLGDSDTIVTRVAFHVADTLKGNPRVEILELDFLGGSLDGVRLSVPGLAVPPVGEEGIYFVEQPDLRQVNPIYGWWQGRFLVRHDDHGRRVPVTHDLESIYEVLPRRSLDRREISVGAAEGIVTRPTTAASRPLSLDEFKGRMRTLADRP